MVTNKQNVCMLCTCSLQEKKKKKPFTKQNSVDERFDNCIHLDLNAFITFEDKIISKYSNTMNAFEKTS